MELPNEMYLEISKHINNAVTWHSWILVCKMFSNMNSDEHIRRFADNLLALMRYFPKAPWTSTYLDRSPTLTKQLIVENPQVIWSSRILEKLPDCLEYCANTSIYDMLKYWPLDRVLNKFSVETVNTALIHFPDICSKFTWDDVKRYPKLIIKWWYFTRSPCVTVDDINNDDRLNTHNFVFNPNCTLDFVRNHHEVDFAFNLTDEFVLEDNREWDYLNLATHGIISFDVIFKRSILVKFPCRIKTPIETLWNDNMNLIQLESIKSQRVPIEFILKHDIKWNWSFISTYVSRETFLRDDLRDKWSMRTAAHNPNLKFDDIDKTYAKQYSSNPSLCYLDVIRNPTLAWNFDKIAMNKFLSGV